MPKDEPRMVADESPPAGCCGVREALRRVRRRRWDSGQGLVVVQFLLLVAVAVAGPLDRHPAPAWVSRVGAILCALCAAWTGLAGVRRLGRHLTPLPLPGTAAPLQTRGIYSRMRHPLYVSTLMLALGWTLWWQSPWAAGGTLVLAVWLHLKVRFEESLLRRQFPGYDDYALQVPRYIPRLFSRPPPKATHGR